MKRWIGLISTILLAAGMPALAEIVTITAAHEVYLSDFRAPGATHGTVSFKVCRDCESRVVSVNAQTRYVLNGKSVSLENFRKGLASVRNRDEETVIVMHHLESDTVTSVSVTL